VNVRAFEPGEFDLLLPLIADYQRFYRAEPDAARNREFFARFLAPSDDGLLLGAWRARELVGYACLYWTFSSLSAGETVTLNDLFVVESGRGQGIGRALIEAAHGIARERGAGTLLWMTEQSNQRAQQLYDRTGAERSAWFIYELPCAP
jgi:GNAT superfamily N-acetyltransferase